MPENTPNDSPTREADLFLREMMVLNFYQPDGQLKEALFIGVDVVFNAIKEYFKGGEIIHFSDPV